MILLYGNQKDMGAILSERGLLERPERERGFRNVGICIRGGAFVNCFSTDKVVLIRLEESGDEYEKVNYYLSRVISGVN